MLNLIGLGVGGVIALLAGVWMVAYRVGFNEGRQTIPLRLIAELAEHKAACEQENPEDVVRELVEWLKLSPRDSERLVDRAQVHRDSTSVEVAASDPPLGELRSAS